MKLVPPWALVMRTAPTTERGSEEPHTHAKCRILGYRSSEYSSVAILDSALWHSAELGRWNAFNFLSQRS